MKKQRRLEELEVQLTEKKGGKRLGEDAIEMPGETDGDVQGDSVEAQGREEEHIETGSVLGMFSSPFEAFSGSESKTEELENGKQESTKEKVESNDGMFGAIKLPW